MQILHHDAAQLTASLAILAALRRRAAFASICPSDAARMCAAEHWRDWLAAVRAAALELEERGVLGFTQQGRGIAGQSARGPVRLVRGPAWSDYVPSAEDRR